MRKEYKAVIGGAAAIAVDVVWNRIPGHERFKYKALQATSPTGEPEKSPLAFIEHYQYGLIALTASNLLHRNSYLDGFGVTLIGSEFLGDQPFGVGKTTQEVTGNLILGSILAGLFLVTL